ncbi:glycoside hydrolase family 88 protein [Hydrogenophaga sp.]|uniref:glycoside hydrolase family 88 protein n=1 Tax=Hydrogenophaga sp. TaxID=1904254 RepID=UPI002ABB812F|nr:glycoside hydrolase family 88 protein [Hydrogenophaga sp.]MDZ4397927.1 glycoside hydrolase family 88 protein [Hydrogenophaga sp.]
MQAHNYQLRKEALQEELHRYAWWISRKGQLFSKIAAPLGWKRSRIVRQWAGRPEGALAWPLGLGLLPLNTLSCDHDFWKHEAHHLLSNVLIQLESEPQLHVDRGGILYAALRLHELGILSPNYLDRISSMVNKLTDRSGVKDGKIAYTEGRDEVLVDTLGMICPALARLSRLTNESSYEDIAFRQIQAFHQNATDSETGWVWHAFNRKTGEPLGLPGWGRGVAWHFLALVDTTLEIKAENRHSLLLQQATELKQKLSRIQRTDGHWPCVLTDKNSHPDTSVTAMVAYGLARLSTIETSTSEKDTNKCLRAALAALDNTTDTNGRILMGSGEAYGIGDYSTNFGAHLWNQGPAVAAEICANANL